jgi:hypothetical protein
MSLRKLTALGLVATTLVAGALLAGRAEARSLATFTLTTDQSEFSQGLLTSGWWNSNGTHRVDLDNYCVGNGCTAGLILRDFFSFDASLLPGCARSATLQIPTQFNSGSGDFFGSTAGGTLVLHDVSTDPLTLNTTAGPNPAIFDDLGTGAFYGSRFFPTVAPYASDSFTLTLSLAAIHDLNAAFLKNDFFSIGGMIAGEPPTTWLFGFTPILGPHGKRPVNLIVTIGTCGPGS